MIGVIDEFNECQGFNWDEPKGFIETLCIDWLFLTFFKQECKFLCVYSFF